MSETASATMATSQPSPGTFQYTIALTNTSSTAIGTFWFAWEPNPCLNLMNDQPDPASIVSPAGWTVNITHSSMADGYGLQWVAGAGADLQPGHTLDYTFQSQETPAQMLAPSTQDPTVGVTEAFVYAGGPESDIGFSLTVPCFRTGTRILTAAGEVAVERLAAGDLVPTQLGGRLVPLRWIGRRSIDCSRHHRPREVWPVCVRAGAFGPGRPVRDLFLSPDHAVHVDDALIPVRYLVNGATIRQQPVSRIEYWHVELPDHDVLFAEGLAVESYLDTGNRAAFTNEAAAASLRWTTGDTATAGRLRFA